MTGRSLRVSVEARVDYLHRAAVCQGSDPAPDGLVVSPIALLPVPSPASQTNKSHIDIDQMNGRLSDRKQRLIQWSNESLSLEMVAN